MIYKVAILRVSTEFNAICRVHHIEFTNCTSRFFRNFYVKRARKVSVRNYCVIKDNESIYQQTKRSKS